MTSKLSNKYLPVFISGFIDGVIVPLTIYSFFTRILEEQYNAIQITLVTGFIMAVLLATGAYFTREKEIEGVEQSRLPDIYSNLGIEETLQKQMTEDTLIEKKDWQNEWNKPDNAVKKLVPLNYSLFILIGYISGLMVVFLNSWLFTAKNTSFLILPTIVLAISGFIKYKTSNRDPLIGMILIAGSGIVSSLVSWLVAGLF